MEETAFQNCSVEITKNLDVVEITSQLKACGLLTQNDFQVLINKAFTSREKVHHLLDVLPTKDRFFEKFLASLDKTRDGTGHESIYNALIKSYAQEGKQRPQDN